MRGERKKFALASRRAVKQNHPVLSNTVLVEEAGQRHVCYIAFSDDLIQFVGQKLPRGVSQVDPAYLTVTEVVASQVWAVAACYYRDDSSVVLWEAKERPKWLKTLDNNRG